MSRITGASQGSVTIHKNCVITRKSTVAYYVMTPFNYSLADFNSIESYLTKMMKVFGLLAGQSSTGIKMSIYNIDSLSTTSHCIRQLEELVRKWDREYVAPDSIRKTMQPVNTTYTILAFTMEEGGYGDAYSQSTKSVMVDSLKTISKSILGISLSQIVDTDRLDRSLKQITNTIKNYAVPATSELAAEIFTRQVFPLYNTNIVTSDELLSYIDQKITPELGSFKMTNTGVGLYGFTPEESYHSLLTIREMPDVIAQEGFGIFIPGMSIHLKTLTQERALLKLKRTRADIAEEAKEAEDVKANDTDIFTQHAMADRAVKRISKGAILCEANINILVSSFSREKMEEKRKAVITDLAKKKVVATISKHQAKDYLQGQIYNMPLNYDLISELDYMMSFQINSQADVGDSDSEYFAPPIGYTI